MNRDQPKMAKPKYVIEPSPLHSQNGLYRMRLGRTDEELTFNEWLEFLDTLMVRENEFGMHRLYPNMRATLFIFQGGFVVEQSLPTSPHCLKVFTNITVGLLRDRLAAYRVMKEKRKVKRDLQVAAALAEGRTFI